MLEQTAFIRTLKAVGTQRKPESLKEDSDSGFWSFMQSQAVSEERPARSTSPSLLTATVGQRVLSRLDDGSGCTSPERGAALWTEEGIRNSRDILQVSERLLSAAVLVFASCDWIYFTAETKVSSTSQRVNRGSVSVSCRTENRTFLVLTA